MTKLEIFVFCLGFFLSSCGTNPGPIPTLQGNPGKPGNNGIMGQPGTSCTVLKDCEKCYLKCDDGTWAYVGKECG